MDSIQTICPRCGHKTQQPIARLKSSDTLTCAVCGEIVENNPKAIAAAFKNVQKGLSETIAHTLRHSKHIKFNKK